MPPNTTTCFILSARVSLQQRGRRCRRRKLSIDDPVLKFFPEVAPADPDWRLKQMRVRDLLTMNPGHEQPPSSNADEITVESFLAAKVRTNREWHFLNNTTATFMLPAIVEKQSGEKLVDGCLSGRWCLWSILCSASATERGDGHHEWLERYGGVLNTLWNKLLPAFHYVPLPKNQDGVTTLEAMLETLELATPSGDKHSDRLRAN